MITSITMSGLLNNAEPIIFSCINEETIIKITTNKGNAVMITEKQFDAFIDCMRRKGDINKRVVD